MVLILWTFGSQTFLLMDAFVAPSASRVVAVSCIVITVMLWLCVMLLFITGTVVDLNEDVYTYAVTSTASVTIQYSTFGAARMFTFVIFLMKGLVSAMRGLPEYRMIQYSKRAYFVSASNTEQVLSEACKLERHIISS